MPRYYIIAMIMVLVGVAVLAKATYTMTADRAYWDSIHVRLLRDSVEWTPTRGNILSANGELLASSLPQYRIYIDFQAMHDTKTDTLWAEKEDSICIGLNRIFPETSVEEFRAHLNEGRKPYGDYNEKYKRNWPIVRRRISYSDFAETKKLPIFNLSSYRGGFHYETYNSRRRPYGQLASRTVGEMYGEKDSARSGLELYYDSVLRGEIGYFNRRKVGPSYLNIPIQEPVDGCDIISTIDINIQDLAERTLRDKLRELDAELGVVIVMEVKTGDVKAMTSLTRLKNGSYRETQNNAVSAMVEPGSVFKTASIMVALEDGYIDTLRRVETGGGVWGMYGRQMRDHNWRRGGYGTLTVPQVLQYSSNIGVSRLIDQYYHNQPEKFVEGIHKLGIGVEMDLPFFYDRKTGKPKKTNAWVRMPKKNSRGQYLNWSKTTLPWMSIGYESQVAPIYTVSFYNAIANKGRFMQPRFVKEIRKDGQVIKSFEPVCLSERICSKETIDQISAILESVVSVGLGKKAGSDKFRVAGKTGTAQVADENGTYKSARYWISFAGFFPYDNPQYSCIVCMKKHGQASGGGMCGPVFSKIAEGVMAQNIKYPVMQAKDQHSVVVPDVKAGNILAADYVLARLGFKTHGGWNGGNSAGAPVWGSASQHGNAIRLHQDKDLQASQNSKHPAKTVPDVIGMGARDAVFMLESCGLKTRVNGCGKVKSQSVSAGSPVRKGLRVVLELG